MRQHILNVVSPGASLFETSTPIGVWGSGRGGSKDVNTVLENCSIDGLDVQLENGLTLGGLASLGERIGVATTIVVPTWPIREHAVPAQLTEQLQQAHENGCRIVGLCLGAFAVASTGLLDGQSAVTHWAFRERFEHDFPAVQFAPDTLYVDNGSVVTSAGSAAALDCCLHLTRTDHGAEAAASLARSLVTAPHRSGAQSQFASAPHLPDQDDPISQALSHAAAQIGTIASVGDLVDLVPMGRRTLERHLSERLGVTPGAWLSEQRVIAACRLLESTDLSVEQVAYDAGYGSTPSMRRALRDHRSTTPTAYRSSFRG